MLILAALLLAPPPALPAADETKPAAKPNIIVILADDMGFSDLGCYGGEIPTPNLDALANNGLLFTQFYNMGRCCPTRAALLTGLYPHQAGVGAMLADEGLPGYRGFLNTRCVTLAEVLRSAGYFTAITGKWHLGDSQVSMWPLQHGFDRFYGTPEGGGFYFTPPGGPPPRCRTVALDNEVLFSFAKPPPAGWYSTDAWTEWGLKFIVEAIRAQKPFFLYLAHNAPHYPLQAPPEDIARYRGTFKAGWDILRAARYARQKALGLLDPAWPLSARDEGLKAWDELDAAQQDRLDRLMAIYAAVVDRLDRSVGKLVAGLKRQGVFENTLILFLSDNGGEAAGGNYGDIKAGQGEPGSAHSYVKAGRAWANLENTPFRLYKQVNHEGGIAAPFIAHWPKGIAAHGELRHQPAHVIDLMPTLVELAGARYPNAFSGRGILPPEGRSLVPAFANQPLERDALYWEHQGAAAVRAGDWKLVRRSAKSPWELYNLSSGRTETHNLAAAQSDRVLTLAAKWDAWAERCNVIRKHQ
jgi:arylsulfatase